MLVEMTQTNIEQDRIDYENWYKNEFKQKYVFNEDGSGYKDPNQNKTFEAWQAALKLQRERQASGKAKSHAEMLQIHEIVMSIDECPPILESDSYLVKAVKNMAYMINQTSKTDIENSALHERDKLGYAVVKVIEKLDENYL